MPDPQEIIVPPGGPHVIATNCTKATITAVDATNSFAYIDRIEPVDPGDVPTDERLAIRSPYPQAFFNSPDEPCTVYAFNLGNENGTLLVRK